MATRDEIKEGLHEIIYGVHSPPHHWVCHKKIDRILKLFADKVRELEIKGNSQYEAGVNRGIQRVLEMIEQEE